MNLPPGQKRILEYFAAAEENGVQASRAEAAQELGYAFPSAVSKHVEALSRKGLVEADRIKKRNVRLTEAGWEALGRTPAGSGVPVVGAIAAGAPILASENVDRFLDDIAPAAGRFALQVRGDSMEGVGILDGDFAVIDHGKEVRDGQIAAVVLEGEATLKRVRFQGERVSLVAENPRYQAIEVDRARSAGGFEMVGPLRFVYRQVS